MSSMPSGSILTNSGRLTARFAAVGFSLGVGGCWNLRLFTPNKDEPFAVRRDLGKVVAHAVVRGSGDGFGRAAFAVVKGDAIEVVLNLRLIGVVGAESGGLSLGARIAGFSTREDDEFSVGAPHAISLHILWIVGSGQRLAQAGGAVVIL